MWWRNGSWGIPLHIKKFEVIASRSRRRTGASVRHFATTKTKRVANMIIDCHGHYTTAPKALERWRDAQIAGLADAALTPSPSSLKISDDEPRQTIGTNHPVQMNERGIALTIFSPRASFMAHHIGDFQTSAAWSSICNELIARVVALFPDRFIGAAMLPQSPGVDPATCLPEIDRCINEYGFVAINLSPDPSGGHWTSPPLSDR